MAFGTGQHQQTSTAPAQESEQSAHINTSNAQIQLSSTVPNQAPPSTNPQMLQLTQYNIRQTQVQLQVTSPVDSMIIVTQAGNQEDAQNITQAQPINQNLFTQAQAGPVTTVQLTERLDSAQLGNLQGHFIGANPTQTPRGSLDPSGLPSAHDRGKKVFEASPSYISLASAPAVSNATFSTSALLNTNFLLSQLRAQAILGTLSQDAGSTVPFNTDALWEIYAMQQGIHPHNIVPPLDPSQLISSTHTNSPATPSVSPGFSHPASPHPPLPPPGFTPVDHPTPPHSPRLGINASPGWSSTLRAGPDLPTQRLGSRGRFEGRHSRGSARRSPAPHSPGHSVTGSWEPPLLQRPLLPFEDEPPWQRRRANSGARIDIRANSTPQETNTFPHPRSRDQHQGRGVTASTDPRGQSQFIGLDETPHGYSFSSTSSHAMGFIQGTENQENNAREHLHPHSRPATTPLRATEADSGNSKRTGRSRSRTPPRDGARTRSSRWDRREPPVSRDLSSSPGWLVAAGQ